MPRMKSINAGNDKAERYGQTRGSFLANFCEKSNLSFSL